MHTGYLGTNMAEILCVRAFFYGHTYSKNSIFHNFLILMQHMQVLFFLLMCTRHCTSTVLQHTTHHSLEETTLLV